MFPSPQCSSSLCYTNLVGCLLQVGTKQADVAMETERQRRVDVALNEEEIKRRVAIANKLLDVQKELLATHQAVKVCTTVRVHYHLCSLAGSDIHKFVSRVDELSLFGLREGFLLIYRNHFGKCKHIELRFAYISGESLA